jgi:predicted nucleotidyltransferase
MSPRVAGIITEYNPFHRGHQYHIEETRRVQGADFVVAVMSGSFVQRGEPAILDKWTRASSAVAAGVDLVLELPTAFAISSAEYFATAGVDLLDQLGIIDILCFGSETGSLEPLRKAMMTLSHLDESWIAARKNHPELSYPALKSRFHSEQGCDVVSKPNDILGIEYLKAIQALNSPIEATSIQRVGHGYHDLDLETTQPQFNFSSASAIRHAMRAGKALSEIATAVPDQTYNALAKNVHHLPNDQKRFDLLIYRLMLHTPETLRQIHDMEDGLPERILSAASHASNYEALVQAIKSKRHTRSRIERVLAKILLDVPFGLVGKNRSIRPAYLRPLAFNDHGRSLLKTAQTKARLPVLTRVQPKDLQDLTMGPSLKLDIRATDLRALLCGTPQPGQDLIRPPVYLR